jgi:carbamoyl-phosphate synthase small subunit
MVGYPETLTDPSYAGQIIVMTYPLIGNYGVPGKDKAGSLPAFFESTKIHARGLVVADYSHDYSHFEATQSLSEWLKEEGIPAIYGIDTRAVTKHLRMKGAALGALVPEGAAKPREFYNPGAENVVAEVSVTEPLLYQRPSAKKKKRVVVVDCGTKLNIIRSLLARNADVMRVPWDYNFTGDSYDGIVVSNGPGDPMMAKETIRNLRSAMKVSKPIFGICLGSQILALAAGAKTYKLPFGHRGHNQPVVEVAGKKRAFITSQNHGYAVVEKSLPAGWEPWFTNANDGTNEGLRHTTEPFMAVQFHPEATPGPTDTAFLFDNFLKLL